MSAGWVVNVVAGSLLLPPLNFILLCLCGIAMRRRWPRGGLTLSVAAMLALALFSTYPGAMLVIAPLERMNPPLDVANVSGTQAIVVLGGGRLSDAPEYGGRDLPSAMALQRLRYAARLQRKTGLPVLVSGGRPDGSATSEAHIMAHVLRQDFMVAVRWLEEQSNNTAENARYSAQMLRAAGVKRILLVTDALHMPRAKKVFQQAGLEVVPAATIYLATAHPTIADYIPGSSWLQRSSYAMHEWLGIGWYRLRYRNYGTE